MITDDKTVLRIETNDILSNDVFETIQINIYVNMWLGILSSMFLCSLHRAF